MHLLLLISQWKPDIFYSSVQIIKKIKVKKFNSLKLKMKLNIQTNKMKLPKINYEAIIGKK